MRDGAIAKPSGCSNFKLRQLTRRVSQHYDGELGKVGLKTTQYSLLSHVSRLGPIRPGELADCDDDRRVDADPQPQAFDGCGLDHRRPRQRCAQPLGGDHRRGQGQVERGPAPLEGCAARPQCAVGARACDPPCMRSSTAPSSVSRRRTQRPPVSDAAPLRELDPRTRQLLQAPIIPTLLRLGAPNVLIMLAQASVGLIETFFVGKLGTDALAGMALVFPAVMLMQTISAGAFGGAIASSIARALGGGRRADADALFYIRWPSPWAWVYLHGGGARAEDGGCTPRWAAAAARCTRP